MPFNRVILIIIDACGVGALPDAADYGDDHAATLPNLAGAVGGLNMPNCQKLGLGNIAAIKGIPPAPAPIACFGRMAERSAGKDSTSGHWEIAGLTLDEPLPLFHDGFPDDLVGRFEEKAGVKTIGNVAASGTEIIERLGHEHLSTGALILYTSADSVFQLAAHEKVCPVERLYEICLIARDVCQGDYGVGRVIARPFTGEPGFFVRTSRRRDFSLPPTGRTILDHLAANGRHVFAVGKIWDLFAGHGIHERVKTENNTEVMDAVRQMVRYDHQHELIFANCVDFDQLWGHRNDARGFARGLEQFDGRMGELLPLLRGDDLLIITADHGCDPTMETSTDHTREYVPLLVYGRYAKSGVDLGTRETFADVAATLAGLFGFDVPVTGRSFLKDVRQ
ncbi:MAG TPA: phosphopentomutase [Acidobacteriota bacterium]|nr:phosphopentomutase [Acidobacteriota bacterium]